MTDTANSTSMVQVGFNLYRDEPQNTVANITLADGRHIIIAANGAISLDEYQIVAPPQARISPQHIFSRYWHLAALAGIGLAAFFVVINLAFFADSPDLQETALALAANAQYWVSALCYVTIFSVGVMFFAHFAQNAWHTKTAAAPAVPQGLLVLVASLHENDMTLDDRLRTALRFMVDTSNNISAVVAVSFRDPIGYLYLADGRDPRFDRNAPPSGIDLPADCRRNIYTNESFEQYQQYCDTLKLCAEDWLRKREHRAAATPSAAAANHLNILRRTAVCLALICTAFITNAQTTASHLPVMQHYYGKTKSEQVARYIGPSYDIAKPEGEILFRFERATLRRNGTGTKTWKQLLTSSIAYTDDNNAGTLQAISINGATVQPGTTTVPTATPTATAPTGPTPSRTGDPVRPYPVPTTGQPVAQQPDRYAMPDSMAIRTGLDHARDGVDNMMNVISTTWNPIWEFVLYVFNSILAFLICVGGLLRYIAKSAAQESAVNAKGKAIVGGWIVVAQQNAAGFLLIITWLIAIVLLIDVFAFLKRFNMSVWALVPMWFTVLWVVEKLTDYIVPNPGKLSKHTV